MDSELDIAQAQLTKLKEELEFEHKVRKNVESLNKKLSKELLDEKNRREAMEYVCEKLAKKVALDKAEIDRMKKDMGKERKMLRMAEALREERVQMKLMEAKTLFEEKLSELEFSKRVQVKVSPSKVEYDALGILSNNKCTTMGSCQNSNGAVHWTVSKRRTSPEAENPHIKRGIKGLVEFPRVVRAISSRGRQFSSKLDYEKAQFRLLRQKSSIRMDNLIID